MILLEEIEKKIRAALAKHNLKLYPDLYLDTQKGTCCIIGAICLSSMDKLPQDGYIGNSDISHKICEMSSYERNAIEAGFMNWTGLSEEHYSELWAFGKKFRDELNIVEEEFDDQAED